MNKEHFEVATRFVNGFFYTFEYYAKSKQRFQDKTPFIYCIGPVEGSRSLVAGINLHHIPYEDRCRLIVALQTNYNILDDDTQNIIAEESLNRLLPGVLFGERFYNLRNVYNLKRIHNKAVPLYLHEHGNIYLGTADDKFMKYLFKSGIYKDSEHLL